MREKQTEVVFRTISRNKPKIQILNEEQNERGYDIKQVRNL